jgi:TRAP transporter TAXI family solute receptor
MTLDDITPSFLSYTDGFTQLGDGNVDAALALAGFPTAAVLQTLATNELQFIELSDEHLGMMLERYPYYTSRSLPAEIYRQAADVVVIGVNNMLIVNTDMDEETVYQVTQAIYGNLDEFRQSNAMARQIDIGQSLLLPVSLHDGASRFFESLAAGAPE